jgi:hypothetical protein
MHACAAAAAGGTEELGAAVLLQQPQPSPSHAVPAPVAARRRGMSTGLRQGEGEGEEEGEALQMQRFRLPGLPLLRQRPPRSTPQRPHLLGTAAARGCCPLAALVPLPHLVLVGPRRGREQRSSRGEGSASCVGLLLQQQASQAAACESPRRVASFASRQGTRGQYHQQVSLRPQWSAHTAAEAVVVAVVVVVVVVVVVAAVAVAAVAGLARRPLLREDEDEEEEPSPSQQMPLKRVLAEQ